MKKQHILIKGTIILTITGFISRLIGFFYRIFLSHKIGAEGLGIYQLIFPISVFCYSLTTAGIQTVISQFVASKASSENERGARDTLKTGLFFSLTLSIITSLFLYQNAGWLATYVIFEPRCTTLLKMLAFSIPFECIHSCINGYYYGIKKITVPAVSQMIEQTARVGSVILFYFMMLEKGIPVTPVIAVYGIIFGEGFAALYSTIAIALNFNRNPLSQEKKDSRRTILQSLLIMSLPLTVNRIIVNLLQSVEAILIPGKLQQWGLDTSAALSVYGILTGMTLPLILFPTAITNSISVLLLPSVAEAQAGGQKKQIELTVQKTVSYSFFLGLFATLFFLLTGRFLGNLLFHNALAGEFIMVLAWISPFLYLSTTLSSILHGLGKTGVTFINNIISLTIRILFVIFGIPKYGIMAYLWGNLISQACNSLLMYLAVKKILR